MPWLWVEIFKNGVFQGSLIILMAVAFTCVYRTTKVFHIAVAVPFLAGGYAAVMFHEYVLPSEGMACTAGVLAGVVLGLAIHIVVYWPMMRRGASSSILIIGTLGAYFLFTGLVSGLLGTDIKHANVGAHWSRSIGGVIVSHSDLQYIGTCALVAVLYGLLLKSTPIGRHLAAVATNERLYVVTGHRTVPLLLLVSAFSGAIAGLCGAYESLRNGVEPFGALPVAIAAAAASILGGKGLLRAAVLGGLVLGMARSVTTQVASDRWQDTVTFGLMLVAVLAVPQILGPAKEEDRP